MKDSEFIDLLNLYLDHEISPADAARLEAEVQNNPARRKVYQQYCRMQKACKMLSADFVTEDVMTTADKKVVAFNAAAAEVASARRKRTGNFYTVGTFAAAAACIAIVFVGRSRQAEAEQASIMAQQSTQVVIPSTTAAPAATAVRAIDVKPLLVSSDGVTSGPRSLGRPGNNVHAMLIADPLLLTGNAQGEAVMTAAIQQTDAQFAWIGNLQLPPIQELRFDTTPAPLRPDGRALGSRASATNPANAPIEMSAFQFVK